MEVTTCSVGRASVAHFRSRCQFPSRGLPVDIVFKMELTELSVEGEDEVGIADDGSCYLFVDK